MAEYEKPCSTKATHDFGDDSRCNNNATSEKFVRPNFRRKQLLVAGTCDTLYINDENCNRRPFFTDVESDKFF